MLFSNNDVVLQSEGGGGLKRPRIAVPLDVWPQGVHVNHMYYLTLTKAWLSIFNGIWLSSQFIIVFQLKRKEVIVSKSGKEVLKE